MERPAAPTDGIRSVPMRSTVQTKRRREKEGEIPSTLLSLPLVGVGTSVLPRKEAK